MKLKIRIVIIIILMLVVGFACQLTSPTPASWSGTPTAKARALTNTAIVLNQGKIPDEVFLITPTQTQTKSTSTVTPQPTDVRNGPWLLYPAPDWDGLHAYDIDAKTITTIDLPKPIYWEDLKNGLSPDGKQLILRAGSPTETDQFALYKIDLFSNQVEKVTPLLSLLLQRKIVNQEGTRAFDVLEIVSRSDGIAWSANSRYLAFSAALDNQSSDLYVFDSLSNRVIRMNGLPTHNAKPVWGLNNNRLISQEFGKRSDGQGWRVENVTGVNVPEFDNQNTFYLPIADSQEEIFVGWLNTQSFVSYASTADGPRSLRRVNIEKFNYSIIQRDSFDGVALDPVTNTIAMLLSNENALAQGKVEGIYLLRPEDVDFRLQRGGDWDELTWDSGGLFIAVGPQGLYAFNANTESMLLPGETAADLSPTGNWMLVWGKGATLYQPPSIYPLQNITEKSVKTVYWQLDSKGFFIQIEETLYYLSFPGLRFQKVEDGFLNEEPLVMAWVAGD